MNSTWIPFLFLFLSSFSSQSFSSSFSFYFYSSFFSSFYSSSFLCTPSSIFPPPSTSPPFPRLTTQQTSICIYFLVYAAVTFPLTPDSFFSLLLYLVPLTELYLLLDTSKKEFSQVRMTKRHQHLSWSVMHLIDF